MSTPFHISGFLLYHSEQIMYYYVLWCINKHHVRHKLWYIYQFSCLVYVHM